ncbi:MAG: hypothetical protein ACRC33_03330 [Gemmataceae bacterium]
MADWKKTAKAILLADGAIDEREVAVLRAEFLADGKVDDSELDFLLELRRDAKAVVPGFHFLMIEALKSCCLDGDAIRPGSASLLRRWLLSDRVGYVEKRYLEELRAAAKQVPPDFEMLYRQCAAH